MKKLISALLLLLCSWLQAQPKLAKVTILHWNDFHAANEPFSVTIRDTGAQKDSSYLVGGIASFLGYLNKERNESPSPIVLNAGDDFQGTPISSITFGRSQIELMNIVRPDAMTLGNHEFDYGSERLRQALGLARFPVISANLFDVNLRRQFVEPVRIVERNGIRIGVVGLTHPRLETLVVRDSLVGVQMLAIDSVLRAQIERLKKENVDLIIALTHIGLENDSLIAVHHPELDVIVSGHDHTPLFAPIRINRSIVVQAGTRGRWLGKLDLVVDTNGDSVQAYSGRLIETRNADIVPDTRAAQKVEELLSSLRVVMNEVIGELRTPWTRGHDRRREDSNVGNWQADVMRRYARTAIAIQNSGGIRANLASGPVTVGDVWRLNPFGNHFVVFEVDGATLLSMLEFQVSTGMQEWCHVAGVRYVFDSRRPKGERIVAVEVEGKNLDRKARYSIVTNNYVAGNSVAHFGIDLKDAHLEPLPHLDRDVFIEEIRRQRIISSVKDGRIKDIAADQN